MSDEIDVDSYSPQMRLKVANICYANVAGSFAAFCNDEYRGPNFQWKNFPKMMGDNSDMWINLSNLKREERIYDLAKKYALEIANTLLERSGFVK